MNIQQRIHEIFPEVVKWRRHLHQHPELSFQEKETARFAAEKLTEWGLEVITGVGGHGVTALLRGNKPGPTVALRADLDALPIQDEKVDCVYRSKVQGVMHACGHDAHTAALLGAAKLASEHKDEMNGNILFIFQPGEEMSPGGALPMIEQGVLNQVDVIYGVHLWTPYPTGKVFTIAGPMMAAADEFTIEIIGKGGHGGLPHETVDSVVIGSHVVVNLQHIVSRMTNPIDSCVVSVGSIHAGTNFNVIADRCLLNGTVRTFNENVRNEVIKQLEQIAVHTCEMFGAACHVDYKLGYPPVINHASEAERIESVTKALLGREYVHEDTPIMAGEDFAYYLQQVPGAFIFVGAGKPHPHHHPMFDIDEDSMKTSMAILLQTAFHYQQEKAAASAT